MGGHEKKILRKRMVKVMPSTCGNQKYNIRLCFLRDFKRMIKGIMNEGMVGFET